MISLEVVQNLQRLFVEFIQGNNRHQSYFTTLDEQLAPNNTVRLIDAFVDRLDLQMLGFTNTSIKAKAGHSSPRRYFQDYITPASVGVSVRLC